MNKLQAILSDLVALPSVTPNDAGCQDYLEKHLVTLGFDCQRFDSGPVSNLFARRGVTRPFVMFAGHTDVVPVGAENQWSHDPFQLHADGDTLYGRGTADMKGSLAAMLDAISRHVAVHDKENGSIGLLFTSGEEGDDFDHGTPHVLAQLKKQNMLPDFCIVGEPSSQHHVGDMIKIGRRGSLSAALTFHGQQGHVAYPHLAINPIHGALSALNDLVRHEWDHGNAYFQPTSMQLTLIKAGGQASNIIPGELNVALNFRYCNEQTASSLKATVQSILTKHNSEPTIQWRLNGEPFLTSPGALVDTCTTVIQLITGNMPELSTSGGTSDARFIAPYGIEVLELGPVSASIHQVNEHVSLRQLELLRDMYVEIMQRLLRS